MIECNAIIKANNEIDKLKRENKKLNALCVQYGFDMGRLEEENEQLKNEMEKIAYANEDLLKEKRLWEKLSDEYAKLYDENEQLRKAIDEADDFIKSHLSFYWIQKWEYYLKYLGVELE